jgi:UDP-glucuronate 4-epimerase
MRVLITGSSGMIGTNLALELLDSGAEVAGIDRRPNPWTDRISTTLLDLSVRGALDGFNWPAHVVVHLAANAKVHATVLDPLLAHQNACCGIEVLEYARKRQTAVVLGSSREVYGNIKSEKTGEAAARVDESASPYSASKLAVEAMGHAYRRCYQLPIAILRFSNVYGRYDNDLVRLERVVPLFIEQIRTSSPVVIFGAEKCLDFTYIDDCVDGIVRTISALLGHPLTEPVINIASGKGTSLLDLSAMIGEALGQDPEIVLKASRTGEVVHYVANIEIAGQLLGYRPRVFLREGIRRSLSWRSEHCRQAGINSKLRPLPVSSANALLV